MAGKKYTVGGTIVLDGEQEYKRALGESAAGLRVNYSEMQLVAAQFDKNEKSTEAYTAKMNTLSGAISAQDEKVRILRSALENSVKANGESSKTTLKYREDLNKAETSLIKMNNQLGEYRDEMVKANEGTDSLSGAVRSLAKGMGLDIPPAADAMIGKLDGVNTYAATLVGLLVGVVGGLGKLTIETSQAADEIMTLSSTTGIATTELQEFMYASELVDVSTDTLSSSLARMTRNMDMARSGSAAQQEAFKELRVKVTESNGTLRDANDVFSDVIDKLGSVRNETERDALAMQIFGRSAKDLNPLIEAGSERLAELAEQAHQVGYIISNETLEEFGALDDRMQEMNRQMEAVKYKFAEVLLPIITGLVTLLSKVPTEAFPVIAVIAGIAITIGLVNKALQTSRRNKLMDAAASAMMSGANVGVATSSGAAATGVGFLNMSLGGIIAVVVIVVGLIALLVFLFAKLAGNGDEAASSMKKTTAEIIGMQSALTTGPLEPNYSSMTYTSIPRAFTGTKYHSGGPIMINDDPTGKYGEIVDLPTGARVYPAGTAPGGDTFILQVNMDEIGDVQRLLHIVEQLKSNNRRQ